MEEESKTKFAAKTCIICFCTFEYRNELFRHLETSKECAHRSGFVSKRADRPEPPTCSLKWSTLFHTPGLHEDLRKYFADAAIDRMEFCVSARTLVAATSHEMVQDAWDAGVLQGLPIGRTGSYLEHERAKWLQKALAQEAPDGHEAGCPGEWDLCLSPRLTNAEASPEILVLVLRYFDCHASLHIADARLVQDFVKRNWDLWAGRKKWNQIVLTFPAIFYRVTRKARKKEICLRKNARTKFYKTALHYWDYEEKFFRFFHQSCGLFFGLSSLKQSLTHYANIPTVMCDAFFEQSIKRKGIVNEGNYVRFQPSKRRSPVCLTPVQSGNQIQCGCSQAHTTTELIVKNDFVLLPHGTSIVVFDHQNKKFLKLDSGDVYNTKGVREFFRLRESYGGALTRYLCKQGGRCAELSNCAYIHIKTSEEAATTSDLTSNFENECSVKPMMLRSILVDSIRTGQLRLALQEILLVWRERDSTITENDILEHVDNAVASGQLVPFVVARKGSDACFFNAESKSVNVKAFLECSTAVLLLSPVLCKPPSDLLHVLYNYLRTEKAPCNIRRLKDVCESCFALRPCSSAWIRLACQSRDEFNHFTLYGPDACFHQKTRYSIVFHSRKNSYGPGRVKARENIKERIEQLDHFIGTDSWPSVEVLLESAKRFGHESLRPGPGRRSRMLAMRWLLEEVAKKRGVPVAQFFTEAENTSDNFGDKRMVKDTFDDKCDRKGAFDNECKMKDTFHDECEVSDTFQVKCEVSDKFVEECDEKNTFDDECNRTDTFDQRCITVVPSFREEESAKNKLDDECSMTVTSFFESETLKKEERGNECDANTRSVLVRNEDKEDDCDCCRAGGEICARRFNSPWSPPMTGVNVAWRQSSFKMQVPRLAWIGHTLANYHPRRAYVGPARVVRPASGERLARRFSSILIHFLPRQVNAMLANDILQRSRSATMDPRVNFVSRGLLIALVFGSINQLDQGRRVTRRQTILSNWCCAKASILGIGQPERYRKQVIGSLVRSPKLKIANVIRVGSVALGLDTPLSDNDILIELENGGIDMVERVYDAIREQQRTVFTRAPFSNFANAVVTRGAFAVSMTCYFRSIEFDIIPVTRHPDTQKAGLWHWNPVTQTWKENVMREIATKVQFIVAKLPSAFHALRLVKMWNESQLPKLRVSSHVNGALKSPLINIHIVLLALQAHQMGAFEGHETTEQSVKVLLKYIETYWDCVTVPEGGLDFAQGYFTEIHAKYESSPRMLAEFPGLISRTVQQWETLCEDADRSDRHSEPPNCKEKVVSSFDDEISTDRYGYYQHHRCIVDPLMGHKRDHIGRPRVADEAWDDGKPPAVGEWDVDEVEAMLAQAGSIIGKMDPNPCSKADWSRTPRAED